MKTSRLISTTQQHSPEATARAMLARAQAVRRVEPMEAASNDRERSLQQDLNEVDPRSVGPYQGNERRQDDARQLAAQLAGLGPLGLLLLNMNTRSRRPGKIDELA
ncbi:hypothetical protein DFR40_0086 [Azonexus fungiphilus]|jgi:hypothetical protein|uniref:Uncharacterized protein n=1 Tax=Azonexus fungiphilus TaxID=146940 RepID=A0A495WNY2_9RHOO|nr:hypothetical protein [Azonexus fungiphilus]NHC07803.1 hypothetical protein [Azonexus fungiphilus]RKT63037.1 hypothetical protein DFR40_0086 [Azonexus fungiphilus]